jgi:Phage stabilisation protein
MAGKAFLPCIGPSYFLPDRKSAVQRAVNLYMRQVEGLGESKQAVLQSTDGLSQLLDLGAAVRGSLVTADQREFVVAGSTLYEIMAGAAVARGTIASGTSFVCLCAGETQLVAVDGANGYVLNLNTNVFGQITSPNWRGAIWVTQVNGTFVFVPSNNLEQFYLSAIDDATNLDALDFSSADAQPGNIVTSRELKQETFFFKPYSTEVWIYDGAADFPLVRYNSTPIAVGAVGLRAVVNAADTLIFVGRTTRGTGIVYMMVGHQPVRISNTAVETALQASGVDLSDCVLWVQQKAGAEFVCINAPGMSTSWCWDAASKQWHERAELVNGDWAPFRVDQVVAIGSAFHAFAGSIMYLMSDSIYSIGSDPLVRSRVWPHLPNPSMEPIVVRGLEVMCTSGYGGQIMMRISKDGGATFGAWLLRSLGAVGRWMQRIRWLGLGAGSDMIFELRVSDAVPFTLSQATVDV